MTGGVYVVLSGSLTFGVPLILAARELWITRRFKDGRDQWRPPPAPDPSPKPLPPCLLDAFQPRPQAVKKQRALEPV